MSDWTYPNNDEHDDRPWVAEKKSETTERFEKEAEAERQRETKNHHIKWWIIVLAVIVLLIVISIIGDISITKKIAGG